MKTFGEIKKNIKANAGREDLPVLEFAILGDTATQFLTTALRGYGYELGYEARVYESEYDVIHTEVLDAGSSLYEKKRDFVVIYMSTEKAYEAFIATDENEREGFARRYLEEITGYWDILSQRSDAMIIQFGMNRVDSRIFGNFGLGLSSSWEHQWYGLQYGLLEEAGKREGVYLLDLDAIQSDMGRDAFCDMRFYYDARMSISGDALPRVAKEVFDIALSAKGRVKKCLVLDLDNTLWGGVIGDDGMEGIELGELGRGRVYSAIQEWCLELKRRGIILAVCSKNDEETAKEPFISHPDMKLHLDDLAMFVANWDDKVTNIRYIQESLNIGMDSIIFLDDNPYERALVRERLEGITVPELPEDPAEWLRMLEREDLFETAAYSRGSDRTKQYREEAERRSVARSYENVNDYLKSLDMKAVAAPFDDFYAPRIAELSQRSNQFNLRTVRYKEDDVKRIAASDGYITRYFTLRDSFGDYGLISAMVMKKEEPGRAFIENWFMSCRVLKRGMEETIINCAAEAAADQGIEVLQGEYIPTPKNHMVEDIYERMGFTKDAPGRYSLKLSDRKPLSSFISILRPEQ